MGNSFGHLFRITTCGESHGGAVAVIVDGCPPGLAIAPEEIQRELDRRRPGQSSLTTPRQERDQVHILSGIFEGETTGTPILLLAYNEEIRPHDYETLKNVYRPSHADFTYQQKYGRRDFRGGGGQVLAKPGRAWLPGRLPKNICNNIYRLKSSATSSKLQHYGPRLILIWFLLLP